MPSAVGFRSVPPTPSPSPRRGDPGDALDVLVVVNDLAPYGSQRVAVALTGEWAASRRVAVATLEAPSERDLPLPPGVVRHALRRPRSRAVALVSLAWQLRRLAARERPIHVLSHMTFANTITLLALVGTRVRPVVVEHNTLSRSLPAQPGGRVTRLLLRWLQPCAGAVVGVSDAVVDDVRSVVGAPLRRLERVYDPAPHRHSTAAAPPHPWLAADRGVTTLVCVGGFQRAKGQDVLVEAMALLLDRREDVRLLMVGEGAGAAAVAEQVERLDLADVVHLAGYQEDALAWISRADVVVIPSRWESFGLVAVEAARCGVPVVATDVPGLREVVPVHVPGWSVAPEDPAALADLLVGLRRPVPPPVGTADLADFEPAAVAERYWSLLEEVAAR